MPNMNLARMVDLRRSKSLGDKRLGHPISISLSYGLWHTLASLYCIFPYIPSGIWILLNDLLISIWLRLVIWQYLCKYNG